MGPTQPACTAQIHLWGCRALVETATAARAFLRGSEKPAALSEGRWLSAKAGGAQVAAVDRCFLAFSLFPLSPSPGREVLSAWGLQARPLEPSFLKTTSSLPLQKSHSNTSTCANREIESSIPPAKQHVLHVRPGLDSCVSLSMLQAVPADCKQDVKCRGCSCGVVGQAAACDTGILYGHWTGS